MITKFVLIVWIGSGNSQSMSVATFDTQAECLAVAAEVKVVSLAYTYSFEGREWPRCIPYKFEGAAK